MKLGELLQKQHNISDEQLKQALEVQRRTQARLGEILVNEGYISEEAILSLVSLQRGFPLLKLGYPLAPEIVSMVPREICRKHSLVPIDRFGLHLLVAMSDPLDQRAKHQLHSLHGGKLKYKYVLATKEDINKAIAQNYPRESATPETVAAEASSLSAHINRIASAVQRFAELRGEFRRDRLTAG